MNTKAASCGMVSKVQRALLAVVVAIGLLGSLPVAKAHAWSYANVSGRPGAVSVPTVRFGDTLIRTSAGLIPMLRVDSNGSYVYAYRSPATNGDQIVAAQYTLQRWTGSSWVAIATQGWTTAVIKAGQSYVAFPTLDIVPSNLIRGYYYRVSWAVAWSTPTGAGLGGTMVVSNLATDHRCVTTIYLCTAYAGSVLLR